MGRVVSPPRQETSIIEILKGEKFICPDCSRIIRIDQKIDPRYIDSVKLEHECGWELTCRKSELDMKIPSGIRVCGEHGEMLYHDSRDKWFCPFCKNE